MKEHLRKVVQGRPEAAAALLRRRGVRVLHRFGDTLVVEGNTVSDPTGDVERATRAVAVEPLAVAPAELRDEDLALLAHRLRLSAGYRRAKERRPDVGEDWGVIFERM
ncbi:hypothetical protein [Accumulibacter sp.]|uniref:hypothetical protein n=1 Tax=Accumulibacter sp. TaxID=2053492 RepID=UPI002614EF1D|nr:hypothetical protein [Accumulibacter sp.]